MSWLDTLSGVDFEKLMGQLLERLGFRVEMTKATGDGGVDIVATLDQPLVGGRYLIQCKRYAPDCPVGAAAVREFYGALTADRGAVKGILMTTSSFTAQAWEFARLLPVELIGRGRLQGLLEQNGFGVQQGTSEPPALVPRASALPGLIAQAVASGREGDAAKLAGELLDLSKELATTGNVTDAVKVLGGLLEVRPPDALAWATLAACYSSLDMSDDAIAALREVVRLMPSSACTWLSLAKALHRVGDLDGGLEKPRAGA